MLNQMDFPSDTPVLPGSSKGSQWGLTLSKNDTGVFEVGERRPEASNQGEGLPEKTFSVGSPAKLA